MTMLRRLLSMMALLVLAAAVGIWAWWLVFKAAAAFAAEGLALLARLAWFTRLTGWAWCLLAIGWALRCCCTRIAFARRALA